MKIFRLMMALMIAFTSLTNWASSPSLNTVDLLRQSEILTMSEKPFAKIWSSLKPFLAHQDIRLFEAFMKAYPELLVPAISAVKLDSKNQDEAVRLIMQYKSDIVTIDFFNRPDKFATVNGITITEQDLKSFQKLYAKLEAPSVGLKEMTYLKSQKTSASSKATLMLLVWTWMMPSSVAAQNPVCQIQTGAICWDSVTGSKDEQKKKLKSQADSKGLSPKDLFDIENQLSRNIQDCNSSYANPGQCATLGELQNRQDLLKSLRDGNPENKSSFSSRSTKDQDSKPADRENKSWLKPAAWITAGVLAFVLIFKNRKKSSSSGATESIPIKNPTNPPNTGVGTQ